MAAVPPIVTVAPATNPVPVMVRGVPPAAGPEFGETLVTVGAGFGFTYVYPLDSVPLCVSLLVTTTFPAPAAWAAVVAVIDVLFTTVTLVAAVPPIVTLAPARNPVPAIVTGVPPAVVPDDGEIVFTVGAGLATWPLPRNVAICIIQAAELTVPVAL